MKFYETHFEDYISMVDKYNFHGSCSSLSYLPAKLNELHNLIFYGPSGVGKYSQVLYLLRRYSPSLLKYEKRMELETDKQVYHYKMSDIHYEVDMSLLGCNSKQLWYDLFVQIVDIVTNNINNEKIGVIVCKNFHCVHPELLDIFYSYMQHYRNNLMYSITLRFILITESVSFLPNNILNSCQIVSFGRPRREQYFCIEGAPIASPTGNAGRNTSVLNSLDTKAIVNAKEVKMLHHISCVDRLPRELFDIVCHSLIEDIERANQVFDFNLFRETLYDLLVYNLDVIECIWFIFSHFITSRQISSTVMGELMDELTDFLKKYNNNYRPIYHLERIFYSLLNKLHSRNE